MPGPLNVSVGVTRACPTCKLFIAIVVLYSLTAVVGLVVGSPLKKLTGTLSLMGKSPLLTMLKKALISRLPHIGGVITTAGE